MVEKRHENVNTQKIKPQIFLDMGTGTTKNGQLEYKAVIFWWVWAVDTAKSLEQGRGRGNNLVNIGSDFTQTVYLPHYVA